MTQGDEVETHLMLRMQAWILDAELQRGFFLGFVLGLFFIWGP